MINQIIINILIDSSCYILVAISFMLIYQICHFFHFAHGIILAAGAYLAFLFKMHYDLPISISMLFAILLSALLGCLIEILFYRPLKKRDSQHLILLLVSLGIYIVIENTISILWGNSLKVIRFRDIEEGMKVFNAYITPPQLAMVIASIVISGFAAFVLKKTKIGYMMRAVASDEKLANITGIDSRSILFFAFAIGSGIVALSGILLSLDVGMTPHMGMVPMIMAIVVMMIGGIGNIAGIILGSVLLSSLQNIGAWYFGIQWQETIAFMVLIIILLNRPQGLLGSKAKVKF